MTMKLMKRKATLSGVVTIEDADELLQWFQNKSYTEVDLADLTHLHSAPLQILMSACPKVKSWPKEIGLSLWLQTALDKSSIPQES